MVDDSDLNGLDPYELMEVEAQRLDRYFSTLDDGAWNRPSRCEGWSVRDLLAHLAASEEYNRACLDATVADFLGTLGARGATDLAAMNELGVRDFDGVAPEEILETWRERIAENLRRLRERDGSDIDTSVGPYPARWQAFHLAFELAVHADDAGVPIPPEDIADRVRWQSRFGRFALKETKPEVAIEGDDTTTHVRGDGVDVELRNDAFVSAVAARLPEDAELDDRARAYLSATP